MLEALYIYRIRFFQLIFDPHRGRIYVMNPLFYKYLKPMGSISKSNFLFLKEEL